MQPISLPSPATGTRFSLESSSLENPSKSSQGVQEDRDVQEQRADEEHQQHVLVGRHALQHEAQKGVAHAGADAEVAVVALVVLQVLLAADHQPAVLQKSHPLRAAVRWRVTHTMTILTEISAQQLVGHHQHREGTVETNNE